MNQFDYKKFRFNEFDILKIILAIWRHQRTNEEIILECKGLVLLSNKYIYLLNYFMDDDIKDYKECSLKEFILDKFEFKCTVDIALKSILDTIDKQDFLVDIVGGVGQTKEVMELLSCIEKNIDYIL